jgi:hypothetical protein
MNVKIYSNNQEMGKGPKIGHESSAPGLCNVYWDAVQVEPGQKDLYVPHVLQKILQLWECPLLHLFPPQLL